MGANLAAFFFAGAIGSVFQPTTTVPDFSVSSVRLETTAAATHSANAIDLALPSTLPPSFKPAPFTITPDDLGVFQSVAISAAKLPAAAKWQGIRQTDYSGFFSADCGALGFSQCDSRLPSAVRAIREQASGLGERDMLDLVNRTVNHAITYRDDSKVWGAGDHWATPVEMARMGAGDCEDYAIAKYWALRNMGLADEQLQIVVLQDTRRQLFHAVLVAHMESGSYVLDNVSNRLLTDAQYSQYQPIMSFAGGKNFIHGFESGTRAVAAMPADLSAVAPGSGL